MSQHYKAGHVNNVNGTIALSIKDLEARGISFIRLQWVDTCNVLRGRVMPLPYFRRLLKAERPGIAMPPASLGLILGAVVAKGFESIGEWVYVMDLDSLRAVPFAPRHACIFGWFQRKDPHPLDGSLDLGLCPRTCLQRVVKRAEKDLGVSFLVGFETEFLLLKSISPMVPADESGWSSMRSVTDSVVEKVLEGIADALLACDIELQMYHAEGGAGQYEIVTGPLPPVQAADAIALTRQIIYTTARRHGLYATLAPRVFSSDLGSSSHVHVSIHRDSPIPSDASPNLYAHEASFLSGLLSHIRSIIGMTLPIPASYARMADGAHAAGTYVCWGTDVREAPVRLCNANQPKSRNFEYRALDQIANPYHALAAILGAGLDGIEKDAPLLIKDAHPLSSETGLSVPEMSEEQQRQLNVTDRLPLSWKEARECIQESPLIRDILSEEGLDQWLVINETHVKTFEEPESEQERMELLVKNY